MSKKTIVALAVAVTTGLAMARPGFHGGGHGGPHGFGHPPMMHHGGFRHHHHHCHGGWGWGLGAAGLALGTAAVVRDIVAPRTVVYPGYCAPVTYPAYPAYTYPATYAAPAVYSAPVAYSPVVTYRRW